MDNRDIKLVCFDLNHTLIEQNSWVDLNLAMGMSTEEDEVLYNLYAEGSLEYSNWTDILQEIYKKRGKATRDNILKAITKYDLLPYAKEAVDYLRNKGYKTALITGSFSMIAEHISRELGIDMFEANHVIVFDEKDYLERIVCFGNDRLAKLRHLEEFCYRLGISINQVACVADGANDEFMFEKTGNGITFDNSPIKDKAWKVVKDLSGIMEIL